MNEFLNHKNDSSFNHYINRLLKEESRSIFTYYIEVPEEITLNDNEILDFILNQTPDGIKVTLSNNVVNFSGYNKDFFDTLKDKFSNDVWVKDFWSPLVEASNAVNESIKFDESIYNEDNTHNTEEINELNYLRKKSKISSLDKEERYRIFELESKYGDYQNDFDDDVDIYESDWIELNSKQVHDSNGFMTDYTLYYNTETEEYACVFGDKEFYKPEDGTDAEFENEITAKAWFNNYKGFEDEPLENEIKEDLYIESNYYKKPNFDNVDIKEECIPIKSKSKTLKYDDLNESVFKDILLELEEEDILKIKKNINALKKFILFLDVQAPREIGAGGNFDSQKEIDEAKADAERELNRLELKLSILERSNV